MKFETITEIEILKLARQRLDQKIDKAEERGADWNEIERLYKQGMEITKRISEIRNEIRKG